MQPAEAAAAKDSTGRILFVISPSPHFGLALFEPPQTELLNFSPVIISKSLM